VCIYTWDGFLNLDAPQKLYTAKEQWSGYVFSGISLPLFRRRPVFACVRVDLAVTFLPL